MFPQLGMLYSVLALIVGAVARELFRQPYDAWFHLVYTVGASGVFVAIFCRPFRRILRH